MNRLSGDQNGNPLMPALANGRASSPSSARTQSWDLLSEPTPMKASDRPSGDRLLQPKVVFAGGRSEYFMRRLSGAGWRKWSSARVAAANPKTAAAAHGISRRREAGAPAISGKSPFGPA